MPFAAYKEATRGKWYLGAAWCWVYTSVDIFVCTSSIWNLLIISVDRFCAIKWPLKYTTKWRTRTFVYW